MTSERPIIIGAAVVVVLAAAGLGYWFYRRPATAPAPEPPAVHLPAPTPQTPQIAHPVPPAGGASAAPLPPLNESDQPLEQSLTQLPGAAAIGKLLVPQNLVRHIVATIDNLPRHKVTVEQRPLRAAAGEFAVDSAGDHITIAPRNAARYAPVMEAVRATDPAELAQLYFRFYPLFQQAYEDLGYPSQYFNDRVIEVIDDLLATPEVHGPIELVQPNVTYQYADPKLEALSAGQKTLLRMGPANEALIKEKLRALRTVLATRPHPGAAGATAPDAAGAAAPRPPATPGAAPDATDTPRAAPDSAPRATPEPPR